MINPKRNRVWWYGPSFPETLVKYFDKFELVLTEGPANPVARDELGLRVILVAHEVADALALRNLFATLRPFQDHGVGLRFVVRGATGIQDPVYVHLTDDPTSVRLLGETSHKALVFDESSIVKACLDHDPGPDRGRVLPQGGKSGNADLDPESAERILVERAFADFEKVELHPLLGEDGGKSGAKVWKAVAHKSGGILCEPFILKLDDNAVIANEKETYDDHVRDQVAFPFRPGHKKGSIVKGRHQSLLVSMFVHAVRYDKLIASGRDPTDAIKGLFAGPLRTWRLCKESCTESLGKVMVDRCHQDVKNVEFNKAAGRPSTSVLPPIGKLQSASGLAEGEATPEQLWEWLGGLPPQVIRYCISHCDLNARNFFLRENGDVVLIDFSHVDEAPLSRDIARIEVATTWDIDCPNHQHMPRFLATPTLNSLYARPLFAQPLDDRADSRMVAVRELRRQAQVEGISPQEYEVMVACHLLRYARHGDGDGNSAANVGQAEVTRLRELSYRLAAGLIRTAIGS